jgi:site-specific DNA-methyltransferase (adenine-specific)
MENQILIHGDCLEEMQSIPDGSIDAIICDPPYGTTSCQWDSIIPLEPMWEQLKRVIKKNGAIVLFGSQPFTSALIMSNMKMFKYCWVWDKVNPSGFQIAKYQPMKQHEDIVIFGSGRVEYYPIKTTRDKPKTSRHYGKSSESNPLANVSKTNRTYTDKHPKTIITASNANRVNRLHPTQKPVALCEYLIKTYTNEGETVLDFTMGSGTTGVACQNLGRKFIGIEKDQHYYDIAKNRMGENLLKICEHNQQ